MFLSDDGFPWAELLVAAEPPPPPHRPGWRVVRGPRCRTTGALFEEWAAALGFPGYFGRNWDAFDDCLGDLDPELTILVTGAQELLADEPPRELGVLLTLLGEAGRDGREHVVLQAPPESCHEFRTRLRQARDAFEMD
ncbi:barstar family protein [Bailinhaonella thermotolerans]|uniref:Barnase inhibitor n=1 Tax=Bailinhaonella thermotolerans TaxID=1070861 RepID=A0A3A4AJY6_9ACTN|nr:barstar family protein [Bailinhaonella thermotolerans]RJL29966.1 barnase inhibitor [Bailinhaonella thermotolerans]